MNSAVVWKERILEVMGSMKAAGLPFGARKDTPQDMEFYPFKRDAKDYGVYWDTRKGLIPIVGGARETGAALLCCCLMIVACEARLFSVLYVWISCCPSAQCLSTSHSLQSTSAVMHHSMMGHGCWVSVACEARLFSVLYVWVSCCPSAQCLSASHSPQSTPAVMHHSVMWHGCWATLGKPCVC